MPTKQKKLFGYTVEPNGNATLNEPEAGAIRLIFAEYLNGKSLGGICEVLEREGIPSPVGKHKWSRSTVDNILYKGIYSNIVTFEKFCEAQFERERRSNINEDTGKRKTTRYSSQNVLSGLLVCAECGANFRRITLHSGAAVWRCASRVEHGKRICRESPTVAENEVVRHLREMLAIDHFDAYDFKSHILSVEIGATSGMLIRYPCHEPEMSHL